MYYTALLGVGQPKTLGFSGSFVAFLQHKTIQFWVSFHAFVNGNGSNTQEFTVTFNAGEHTFWRVDGTGFTS
jgi:hypothetical protein